MRPCHRCSFRHIIFISKSCSRSCPDRRNTAPSCSLFVFHGKCTVVFLPGYPGGPEKIQPAKLHPAGYQFHFPVHTFHTSSTGDPGFYIYLFLLWCTDLCTGCSNAHGVLSYTCPCTQAISNTHVFRPWLIDHAFFHGLLFIPPY